MAVTFIRRNVHLTHDRRLIFDIEDDLWRIAVYRPRYAGETGGKADPDTLTSMERAGMLPARPSGGWFRSAVKDKYLDRGIKEALNAASMGQYYSEVRDYIRQTEWGKDLL